MSSAMLTVLPTAIRFIWSISLEQPESVLAAQEWWFSSDSGDLACYDRAGETLRVTLYKLLRRA